MINKINILSNHLCHDVVTFKVVDHNILTAYCWSSSHDEVDLSYLSIYITKVDYDWQISVLAALVRNCLLSSPQLL